jgi:2-methylcitrate dehydratase PrpD
VAPVPTPPEGDAAAALVRFAVGCRYEDLPADTVVATKRLVLDTLGAALAGADAAGVGELRQLVTSRGGRPETRVWGSRASVPAPSAALVNATAARALELDDVHEVALVHSTATMLPVALAVADHQGGVSGRDVLTAVAVGIEICVRLALATEMSLGGEQHVRRVMSLTTQAATLAGALVAAKVAGLAEEQAADAFGVAYRSMPGNLQMLLEGARVVRVMQGVSAQLAVQSAELAALGIDGPRRTLEGPAGFYPAFHRGAYDRGRLLGGLGEAFRVPEVSIKPYACCKAGHTAISAAVEAAAAVPGGFAPDDVERIVVHIAGMDIWDILVDPPSRKADPDQLAADGAVALAQFSLPFMVACGVLRRGLTVGDLSPEARADPGLRELIRRTEVVVTDTVRGVAQLPEPGHVELHLKDGRSSVGRSDRVLGHHAMPMTDEQVSEKFWANAQVLGTSGADRIVATVLDLESLDDVRVLTPLTVP